MCVGRVREVWPDPASGQFLLRFDPAPRPHGTLHTTADPAKAKRFADHAAAFTYWNQAHGVRPDGLPNKPLTAWTIETLPADGLALTDALKAPPTQERH